MKWSGARIVTTSEKDALMEEMISMQLGQYTLTHRLARGGMSEVYLARKQGSEETYALKLVMQQNEEYYQRFQREANALNRLAHPHILPILDYGEQDGMAYYVTPYIERGSLKKVIADGPLDMEEAATILAQVGDALHFMHEAGLVHRDIKSANILLDQDGKAWLADFGLAIEVGAGSDLTKTTCLIGTPSYMAPELMERPASVSSDIYALGVVLYEMLTGHLPFTGHTALEICWKHSYLPPPLPSMFNRQISRAIEEVILRALEKEPRERFATVREMVEAYQQSLSSPGAVTVLDMMSLADERSIDITLKPVRSLRLPSLDAPRRRPLAVAMLMLALLFALGSFGLAIELESHTSASINNNVQMLIHPTQPAARSTPSPATPSAPAAGARSSAPPQNSDQDTGKNKPPHKHHKGKD